MVFVSPDRGSKTPEGIRSSPPRVLLLSKSEGFGEFLKDRLPGVDFQIGAICTTAEEAISYIEAGMRLRAPFHVVFTTEPDQLLAIRRFKDIPKILLTPNVTGLSQKERKELGISRILDFDSDLFPYQAKDFLRQINK